MRSVIAGAYYARQLGEARSGGRIGRVAADPLMTLRAVFDIGGTGAKADAAAIWIGAVRRPRDPRGCDYYEAQGQPLAAHVAWLRAKGYGPNALVHAAARRRDRRPGARRLLRKRAAPGGVRGDGGAATRARARRPCGSRRRGGCSRTCGSTRRNARPGSRRSAPITSGATRSRGIGLGPAHDWASHAADAFGLGAVAYEAPSEKRKAKERPMVAGGWMETATDQAAMMTLARTFGTSIGPPEQSPDNGRACASSEGC